MGAARAAGEEAKTAAQARVRALIADMDLAGRDEVEALKAEHGPLKIVGSIIEHDVSDLAIGEGLFYVLWAEDLFECVA